MSLRCRWTEPHCLAYRWLTQELVQVTPPATGWDAETHMLDDARYVFAVLVVTFLPPGVAWWFVVHPFVGFWRRLGPRWTLTIVGAGAIVMVAALMLVRDRLVMADLGTHPTLFALAVALFAVAVWIALQRRRLLTTRILAGIPELDRDGGGGSLLTEGIYALIRHPRYVEVAIGTFAYAVFANYLGAYLVAAATVPALHLIVLLEERELLDRFGEEYEEYRRRVPRYLPRRHRTPSAA
jgi:protein-S-isoprenylcysteine O-methyltransferase Ste14